MGGTFLIVIIAIINLVIKIPLLGSEGAGRTLYKPTPLILVGHAHNIQAL